MLRENIIDARFAGREVTIKVLGREEPIKGVIDEVARYEIGLRSEGKAVVVYRHSILSVEVEATDLHGYSNERLQDTVINSDLTGTEIEFFLIDGSSIKGKLMKVSKYEIGIRIDNEGFVIPKSAIAYAVVEPSD